MRADDNYGMDDGMDNDDGRDNDSYGRDNDSYDRVIIMAGIMMPR